MREKTSQMNTAVSSNTAQTAALSRFGQWITQYWARLALLIFGLYIGLPWLAPIFMQLGWTTAANLIYAIYSTQCHQMPQRSFFLFGEKTMYSLNDVQAVWKDSSNPLILRQFNGNSQMGWKVAWSDRMVFMYGSIILFGIPLFWLRNKKIKPIAWWGFLLLLLPMAIDGGTHLISDFSGIGNGFRDGNIWLATLTNNAFTSSFYAGDALGSFNSWMRLLTGLPFGLGIAWFLLPFIQNTQK
ncbi:hypothetical protein MNBD_CHLOROFLEXI01-4128 [hydrothermal vent metagenome]|uniref:DUF2085 domain-containing protein n=1 Tax=hydrothermal vent metagenome TaxID=652676 RepID=A0A3B0VI99_9ZZZZ